MLRAENLYKSCKERVIVSDVSLCVNKDEIVGLLGPNGAGKSTCFHMISGSVAAGSGKILLDGQDITNIPLHRRVHNGLAYLPQECSLIKDLSVRDNILIAMQAFGYDKYDIEKKLYDLLSEFEVAHLIDSSASTLSGGEKRRVEIARSLISKPRYLLMDEPFAGVDPISIDNLKNVILSLKERGIGVFITDHNVNEIADIADGLYVMHQGNVIAEGYATDVLRNKDVQDLYLGSRYSN